MTNSLTTAVISNSASAFDATDDLIIGFAKADGKGEVARVDFLETVAKAYLEGTLAAHQRTKKNGDVIEPTEGDYAQHAWTVWNTARAKVLGKADVRPVKDSRKSELSVIFKASRLREDIVAAARTAVTEAAAEDAEFKGKTYEGIVKVARAQVALAKAHGADVAMSDAEVKAALYTEPKEKEEEKEAAKIVKALEKLAEEFPANADIYNAAKEGMSTLLATLAKRKERAEKEAAFAKLQAELYGDDADDLDLAA